MGGAAAVVLVLLLLLTTTTCEIVFEVEPEDVLTATGSSARFDCTFTTSSPASLSWLHDGAVISLDSRHTYHTNGSLQISPTAEEDEGVYTCRVADTITGDVQERTATLTLATILDSFLVGPDSTTVDEGDALQLFCIHSGSLPAADITWLLDGTSVVPSSRISVLSLQLSGTDPPQTSSSLYTSSAQPSDAGSYVCEARNELLPNTVVTSSEGVVTVIGVPRAPTITEQPSDTTVVPGNTATFTCSASGQPSPSFNWCRNGNMLTSEEVSITSSGGRSTLSVNEVGEEEEGEYHCQAGNSQGTADSDAAELMLAYLDSLFQLSPQNTVAIAGTDTRFDCLPPNSNPSATLSWTRDFAQLPNTRFSVLSNGSLLITSVAVGDEAEYHCVATNDLLGVSSTGAGAQLTVLSIPTVTPDTISVSIGDSATFLCEVPGSPPPSLMWYNGTTEITASTPRTTITSSTLTLVDIVREDQGEYVCTATYANGTTQASAMLLVNAPPLFVDSFVSLTTIEGQEVTLPCNTLPDPTLTFTWSFNDITISLPSDDEGGPTLLSNGSLLYASAVDGMEGNYTCEASNSLGTVEGTVQLTVFVSPSLTPSPSTVTITEGHTAVLSCEVVGDPVPVLTWYHIGTLIAGENEASLRLEEVMKEQEGLYECAASNQAGDDRATITLVVNTHPTVEASPSLLELLIGSTASFLCVTSGDPAPLITWYNEDNTDVTSLGDPRVQVVGGTLSISTITDSDSQLYTCTASNTVGSNSTTVELNVLVGPAVSLPPSLVASQGDPLSLDCSASGNPSPSVVWYKDGQLLPTNGRVTVSSPDRVVIIASLFSTDEGNYTCVAINSQGSARATTLLTVLVIPVIHAGVSMVTVNEGDTAVLDCNATGNPPPTVSWFKSSLPVPEPGDTRIQQVGNNSLIVMRVGMEDEGEYVCQATNIAGSETATLQLVVNIGPVVTALENFITVVEGSEVTLSCTATGQPTPSVTWIRNGGEVPTDSTPNLSSVEGEGEGSLTISPVGGQDEGTWVCVGTNIAGSSQETIMISVLVPPTITSFIPSVTITEGTPHTLTCTATGEPLPLISWSRGGVAFFTQGSFSFDPSTQRSDAGVYTCTATNTAGTDSRNTTVNVLYAPTITQSPVSQTAHLNSLVQFECVANGNPDPVITWNFQGTTIPGVQGNILTVPSAAAVDVGTYTCVATNTVGEDTADATLTVLFPPSPPVLQGAVATSSTTISLQWTASTDDGGSPLVSYIIEYRLSNEIEFSDSSTTSADTLSTTITGLTPYGQYELRVRGENVVGSGDPSNSLLALTHPDAPSAPGDLRVVSSTGSSLSLAWSLPDPLNGQLAAYELQYGEEETFDTQRQTRLLFTTQYVVTGLEEGVTYLLQVRASTISLGGETLWGPYSLLRVRDGETLEIPTLPPPPSPSPSPSPSPPPSPSPSPSSVLASTTSRGMPVSSPPVATTATATSVVTTSSLSPSSPLATGTTSTSSLSTTSSFIISTSSAAPSTFTSTLSPSPTPLPPTVTPTTLSLSATDVGTITVSWKSPLTGLDSIDGYAVFLSPLPPHPFPNPIITPHNSSLTTYTFTITNLTSFTDYTVAVATYNDGGLGPLSLSGVIRTVESAPTAPRNVTVTIIEETTTILVAWLPPEMPNGVIISYTVKLVVNSTEQEVLSLPIPTTNQLAPQSVSVPGLELDSVRYRITVEAATRAGTGPPSDPVYVGTDVLPGLTDTLSSSERDASYYTVRILPPLLGVSFIGVAVVMLGLFCRYNRNHRLRKRRKGIYKLSGSDNGSEFELGTKVNEGAVARDDMETSVYYVKNALDANVTYAAGPQVHTVREREEREVGEQHVEEGGSEEGEGWKGCDEQEDVDMPGFHPSDEEELIGRDALQESPSHAPSERPESLEFPSLSLTHTSPSHPLTRSHMADTGGSTGSIGGESQDSLSRPSFQPGDYSYEELDAIRARKVQQREKRFRKINPESTGYSSGGLMETRIGAVGNTEGGTRESPLVRNGHTTPAELAHMY